MAILVRPATDADIESIYGLVCALECQGDERMDFEKFKPVYLHNVSDASVVYLVAEGEGFVVAFGSMHVQQLLHHCGLVAEVQELVVSEGSRGKGVGVTLLEALEAEAKRRGCLQIELCCNMKRVESNAFYGRRGYNKTHYKHTKKFI